MDDSVSSTTTALRDQIISDWTPKSLLEIELTNSENFLKVRETLTRMGIPSRKEKALYQTCHILHKMGKYYIVHFKELFALDGKPFTLTYRDRARRNTIARLLEEWKLVKIVNPEQIADDQEAASSIKVLTFAEKKDWQLIPKYSLGKRHVPNK